MTINVTEHGTHIAIICLDNQPKCNALSRTDLKTLGEIWLTLQNSSYRCLILTGAGDKSFCSGADLSGDLSAAPELSQTIYQGLLKYQPMNELNPLSQGILYEFYLFLIQLIFEVFFSTVLSSRKLISRFLKGSENPRLRDMKPAINEIGIFLINKSI